MSFDRQGLRDYRVPGVDRHLVYDGMIPPRTFTLARAQVLLETADYRVVIQGDDEAGEIGLLHNADDWLAYFIAYNHAAAVRGIEVTEVTLWRDDTSPYTQGITRVMFDEILLPKFGTVMSDGQPAPNGMSFWVRQMVEAASRGLTVGALDVHTGDIEWRPQGTDVQTWARSVKAKAAPFDGLGHRPLISRVAPAAPASSALSTQDTPGGPVDGSAV